MNTNKFFPILILLITPLLLFFTGERSIQDEGNLYINSDRNYLPGDEVQLNVNGYNLKSRNLQVRLYRIKDVFKFTLEVKTLILNYNQKFDESKFLDYLELVDEFSKRVTPQHYNWVNENISLGKIERTGIYIIAAQVRDLKSAVIISISEIGLITKNSERDILVYVSNRKTSEPIPDAYINLLLGTHSFISLRTDDAGLAYRKFSQDEIGQQILVVGKSNNEQFLSDNYLFSYFNQYDKIKVYSYTNQPVYRPNQKVQFKSIVRENFYGTYSNYPNKAVTVSIRNPKSEEVYSKTLKTNNNGTVDGTFELDEEPALGDYALNIIVNSQTYSSSFRVEEYKKPEYKVVIETDKSQYTFGSTLKGKVKAEYYFGSPVSTADVKYEIYKRNIWRPWWHFEPYAWFYRGCFMDYYPAPRNILLFEGDGKISPEGEFEFEYKIEEKSDIDFEYFIVARVTDQSRREIQGSIKIFVSRGEFQISTNPEKYLFMPKEKVQIKVRAFDFAEKPVQTKFIVYIRRQLTELNETFIEDVDTLYGETKSDGVSYVYFHPKEKGIYSYLVKAYDSNKNIITAKGNFWVNDRKGFYWNIGGLQIITDKDVYKAGDNLEALIISPIQNANALITIEHSLLHSYEVLQLDGFSTTLTKEIKRDFPNVITLAASFFYDNSVISGQKRIAILPEEKFLNVEIENDKPIYKPNSTGEITVRVRDNNRNPVRDAEFSIGTIDESIYAIKDENIPNIKNYFYTGGVYYLNTSFTSTNYYYQEKSRQRVEQDEINYHDLDENGTSSIEGKILNEQNDSPIEHVLIILQKCKHRAETKTNKKGEFSFTEINAGEYTLILKRDGYISKKISGIRITKNQKLILNNILLTQVVQDFSPIRYRNSDMMLMRSGVEEGVALLEASMALKSASAGEAEVFVEPELRRDFRDAVLWEPAVRTDKNGTAKIQIKYPDNLTTWRSIVRVITQDSKVGQEISKTITRKDLIVRMETPRYLREKDEITISTMIHNYLSEEKLTHISLETKNAQVIKSYLDNSSEKPSADNKWKVKIPKDSEIRINWVVSVVNPTNEIVLTATALTNEESDAVEMKIPVEPYGVEMVESDIASISDFSSMITKEILIPENVDVQNVKLFLSSSPSLAATILGALDDLVGYPYGCVEQTMSRFLPTIVVANVFRDLNAPLKEGTIAELPKMVSTGLKRLYDLQHSDGGWGWWANDKTHPFMTAYVVYGLALTKQANYTVDENIFVNGLQSLKNQLRDSRDLEDETKAYMLYSLAFAEYSIHKLDYELFDKIFASISDDRTDSYVHALLYIAAEKYNRLKIVNNISRSLVNNAVYEGQSVYWTGEDFKYRWQEDKVQTTALAIRALLNDIKNSEIIEKAVRWLLLQRRGSSWNSTKQTAMAIFALTDYLKKSKELEPDFSFTISINDKTVQTKSFTKENLFDKESKILIDPNLLIAGNNKITIAKQGRGKLYYSSLMKFYSTDRLQDQIKDNFEIQREYYFISREKDGDSYVNKLTKFNGLANSGDELLVRIKVHNRTSQEFFMLEDPIPPGCEVVKDETIYNSFTPGRVIELPFIRRSYTDREIHDEKAAFFTTWFGKGDHEFSYILRAQIPGNFNVMPSIGMLMYYPEVRGTSLYNKFKIVD
jgi:uncharacterized protein YfaS (alpha-2-macroglobulin family)